METVKEENEKKKEYLKQYGKALRQEKRIEEELERLKLDRMLPGALAADGLPKSSNHSDLSDYMAKIDELDNEKEKDVLTKRYIDCEGWNRICDETGYRWTQVHRNHSEALKKFKMV